MLDELEVKPGTKARIAERDPGSTLGFVKQDGEKRLERLVERLDALQYRLYAEDRRSVLLVLQGGSRMYDIAPETVWRPRYGHIREFERMLVDEGPTVLKVFLNVSREEQRARFQARIDDPTKRWKFRRDDLKVRARFDDWVEAWDEALTETSTE